MDPEAPALEASEPVPQKYNWRISLWVGILFTVVSIHVYAIAPKVIEASDQIKAPSSHTMQLLKMLRRISTGYPAGWIFLGFATAFASGFIGPSKDRTARKLLLIVTVLLHLWIGWTLLNPVLALMDGLSPRGRR